MNRAIDAHGDEAGVDDEEAGVESPRASWRSDGASKEVDGVKRRMHARRGEADQAPGGGFAGAPKPGIPTARPVSSKVSRIAASARARAKPGEGRRTRALSFSSTAGSSAPAAAMRRSSGSTRPPGKTNLPGMNRWPACRLPISTRAGPCSGRSTRMSVAASRGRSARPG